MSSSSLETVLGTLSNDPKFIRSLYEEMKHRIDAQDYLYLCVIIIPTTTGQESTIRGYRTRARHEYYVDENNETEYSTNQQYLNFLQAIIILIKKMILLSNSLYHINIEMVTRIEMENILNFQYTVGISELHSESTLLDEKFLDLNMLYTDIRDGKLNQEATALDFSAYMTSDED